MRRSREFTVYTGKKTILLLQFLPILGHVVGGYFGFKWGVSFLYILWGWLVTNHVVLGLKIGELGFSPTSQQKFNYWLKRSKSVTTKRKLKLVCPPSCDTSKPFSLHLVLLGEHMHHESFTKEMSTNKN